MNMNRRMVSLLVFVGLSVVAPGNLFPVASTAQQKPQFSTGGSPIVQVRRVNWSDLKAAGQALPGELVKDSSASPSEQLVVEVSKANPAVVQLFALDDPGVGPPGYAMSGSVKCEDIASPGYLEMWNYFPDGSYFFTRTLGSVGPMAALQGSGDWRRIELPFTINLPDAAEREKMRPNKLVVNLVLPTGGKVYLSNFELSQHAETAGSATSAALPSAFSSGAWWSPRTAGVMGGVLGSIVGAWGALIGILTSFGCSPRLLKGLLLGCAGLGATIVAVGATALLLGQPWSVGGTLTMVGLPATFVPLWLLPTVMRNSQERELRRMQALDVGV